MPELIDLSQTIRSSMPVHKSMPPVRIRVHATHEEWAGEENPTTQTPSVLHLDFTEHTGTHVDALNHMGPEQAGQSIDTMPLSTFFTEGICLDLSYKGEKELIHTRDIQKALDTKDLTIRPGDTVLLYTDHYRRTYGTSRWADGPGLSAEAARWLGEQRIAAFGVETVAPGVSGISNKEVHRICGELRFTHYENLINLHQLVGRGRFRFIGLPLKIEGGTGSPVRAVAVFEG